MNHTVLRKRLQSRLPGAMIMSLILLLACQAMAIQPGRWVHTSEADFEPGETDKTVVTNLGDVKLSAASTQIGQIPEEASIINDLVQLDDVLYLAAGPEGQLLRRSGDQIESVLSLKGEQIFAMALFDGKLLVGISGSKSRLAVLEEDKLSDLHIFGADIRYIWDLLVLNSTKRVIVATGTKGKLLSVDLGVEQPEVKELFDAEQPNVLCLAGDTRGNVYAGTDTDGLVYWLSSLDEPDVTTFVIYDAPEPEIATLLVTSEGIVYAGTADAKQAKPGRLKAAADKKLGRPEAEQEPDEQAKNEPELIPEEPEKVEDEAAEPSEPVAPPEPPKLESAESQEPREASEPSEASEETPEPVPNDESASEVDLTAAPMRNQSADQKEAKIEAEADARAEPTREQRDALRAAIRARLEEARKPGGLQAPSTASSTPSGRPSRLKAQPAGNSRRAPQKGNAIYRFDPIDPDGLVEKPEGFMVKEVFRESVMILSLATDQDTLLVGTGSEGQLYRVDPAVAESTIVADFEPQQLPTMLVADEHVLLGTANPAALVRLDRRFSETGTYISNTLDASQVSLWGKLKLTARISEGTSVAVQTRSGNVEDPEQAAWSKWFETAVFKYDPENISDLAPREGTVNSLPARFMQYQLTLNSTNSQTPVIDQVEITYVVPNLKPVIRSIKTSYGKGKSRPKPPRKSGSGAKGNEPEPQTVLKIEWEASDPNQDNLQYNLEYRLPAKIDQWLLLAEDLMGKKYEWDTRRLPDGRYLIRVTASDEPDNTSDMAMTARRLTDPVVVDNTKPDFEIKDQEVDQSTVTFTLRVVDTLSPVKAVHYKVGDAERWKPLLPQDLIYDSTVEDLTFRISDLLPGQHLVSLRAMDAAGNARYEAEVVEIE